MADKHTLTIDALDSSINLATATQKSTAVANYKLKITLNAILAKSKSILFAGIGLVAFGGLWSLLSLYTEAALPGPLATLTVLKEMLSDPFYDYGPNDKGIGLQLFNSIKTVLMGFFLGSLIAIPIGILMGANTICKQIFYPIVQLLKPVSPLAWFP
ncbi:MAG: nitrate/nitrite transport system permease protein, partial [Saprospiraceae bacterium]